MKNSEKMRVADSHCDFLYKYSGYSRNSEHSGAVEFDVTRRSLEEGGVRLQVLAAFANFNRLGKATGGAYRKQAEDFPAACRALGLAPIADLGQLSKYEQEEKEGKEEKYALLAVEGCEAFSGSLERAKEFIDIGAKLLALTWNHENELAFPHMMAGGIKPFGRKVIGILNERKCAVDVSHLSEEGFWQVVDNARGVCASHSCCRALCDHSRNLSDKQIKAIIAKGGYIGVNFYPPFLREGGRAQMKDIAAHVLHIINLGGENNVGFGSDFDGIDKKTEGMESPAGFPALIKALEDTGMDEGILRKTAYSNFAGFLQRISI
ncbi:MAG: dipeptidase [Christensenellales bacterium]|jgi:membrane dipeptidase